MRKSKLQLYAPFIALALAQAAFVVWAPSEGEVNDPLANLQVQAGAPGVPSAPSSSGGTQATGGSALGSTTNPTTGVAGTSQQSTASATQSGSTATGGVQATAAAGVPTGGGGDADVTTQQAAPSGSTAAAGDTSHCSPDGKQSDLIATTPACKPKFVGDNGGATYPGVTGTEVKMVHFGCQSNEQVEAILQTQGLASTPEETAEMTAAVLEWMNSTYEFYGRTLVSERVVGDCPSAPSDPAKSRQAAEEMLKEHQPMFVYGGDPSARDVFVQNGVVNWGGAGNSDEFFTGLRPFRWDIFPDGTEAAEFLSEYYCKKLAGGTATHAGQLIHPTIGGRTTARKPGILTFDNGDGTTVGYTKRTEELLEACHGGDVPVIYYESNIDTAAEQTRTVTAKLIDEKVTTLICLCDPIAPAFLTNGLSQNNYYPEHLLSSMYLTDYDVLGRLYAPEQWAHAFGPSQLARQPELSQSNAGKIWTASGRDGEPCDACNLITGYLTAIGSMIHYAGPNLNPLTAEQGLVGDRVSVGGWHRTGGNPYDYLIEFGPGDYNAISDYREVYWSSAAISEVDGKPGAYVSMNEGRRYVLGELDSTFEIPAAPQ